MSTTTEKRPIAQAREDAAAFRALFDGCFDRWEVAGSVRRLARHVGDIEHVVIPTTGEVIAEDGRFIVYIGAKRKARS